MKTKSIITFPCPWSMGVTFLTAITVIILVISVYVVWTNELIWLKYMLIIICLATIIGVLLLMPVRQTIERNKIALHRFIGSIHIPFEDIIELKAIPNSETAYSIRLLGSGGLCGYLGKFRNKKLGYYTMYATNLNELILIRTNRKAYVFSCKNRDEFIESFNSLLGNHE